MEILKIFNDCEKASPRVLKSNLRIIKTHVKLSLPKKTSITLVHKLDWTVYNQFGPKISPRSMIIAYLYLSWLCYYIFIKMKPIIALIQKCSLYIIAKQSSCSKSVLNFIYFILLFRSLTFIFCALSYAHFYIFLLILMHNIIHFPTDTLF